MHSVYANCIVNLSLAQVAHPGQSCFGGYTFDSTPPFEAEAVGRAHGRGSREIHNYTVLSIDYFQEALYRQPVGRRAWVMQERLLATRVLSIAHGELFWDCYQVPHASESLPNGFTLCSELQRGFFKRVLHLSIPSLPHAWSIEELEEIWSGILEEYTARELTYPQADKLVALSAISIDVGYFLNDTYLCGHLRRTVPRSLNWKTIGHFYRQSLLNKHAPKRLPKSSGQMIDGDWHITPSWSWASMDCPISTLGTLARSITFFAVMEAYKLFPVGRTEPEAKSGNKLLLTIRTLCHIIEWRNGGPEYNDVYAKIFKMDDMDDLLADGSQYLLAGLGHHNNLDVVQGLILREIDFDGNKVYERMGHFSCFLRETDANRNGGWKTHFTHGERSITLC
ncbi:hypothetical protein AA0113_g10300 [Alternaria arborescens]|uniref:Heterokaryon incompatibility domain-containing protein n=1 Tax=Alternaria arborescens TaxID=156630 RepID=A0A4Q4QQA3_9PLEO|nr:hypothetical protein AA0113_g10300 [Alternaria arborescens]